MRLHLEALFTVDDRGRLVSVNDGSGAPAPRFFMGWTRGGNVWAVHHRVEADMAAELEALAAIDAPALDEEPNSDRIRPYLDLLDPPSNARTWTGPSYCFPDELPTPDATVQVTQDNVDMLRPHLEAWSEDFSNGVPVFAALQDQCAVSVCASVRITGKVHEAGVETHPDFRGRGCATRVVNAWAVYVRSAGLDPLYSTSWENVASRRLAQKLNLRQYGSVLHVT
jgi:RimJ/RimL family protein N-acetyltransferase